MPPGLLGTHYTLAHIPHWYATPEHGWLTKGLRTEEHTDMFVLSLWFDSYRNELVENIDLTISGEESYFLSKTRMNQSLYMRKSDSLLFIYCRILSLHTSGVLNPYKKNLLYKHIK